MKKIKECIKGGSELLIIQTCIIILGLLVFGIVLKLPFITSNDQWFQYNIFYKEWIRLVINFIKTGNLPMYSWNMYLGTDFYSAMGYYCTGDIFLPILIIFRNNIEIGLIIETIICIYLSSIFMDIFLRKYVCDNKLVRISVSIIYSLSGTAALYCGQYMFHRFYAFLPLLFIGLLNYFNNKKVGTFIVATAILFLQNYYFMYPTLIFLFIFSLMYEIKNKKIFKDILKDFFILLGCLLLGFMISAVITLPSMMYLLNNPRVGETSEGLFWQRNTYYGLFMSLITYIPWSQDNIFMIAAGSGHDKFYSLFIGGVALVSFVSYIIEKENRSDLIVLILLVLIACIKPLSSLMHGLSSPSLRWTFLLEFYILIISAKELCRSSFNKKKYLMICCIYTLLCIVQIVSLYFNNYIDFWNMKDSVYIIGLCLLLFIVVCLIFVKNKNLGIILSVIEISLFYGYDLYIKTKDVVISNNDVITKENFDYYKDEYIDNDVFRYYHSFKNNTPDSVLNENKSLEAGFMSTSTYNSTTDYNINEFNKLTSSSVAVDWALSVGDPYAATMLGTKYWIVYKETELPEELEFEFRYNLNYLSVYENLSYQGFGYTSNKLKYTSDFTNTKDFIDYILVDDESIDISKYTNISYSKLNITSKYDNYLEANITLEEDNILLIPIPNNKGWTIRVNGKEVTPISVNGGFIGLELSKGTNEITMNFISPYFKEGLVLTTLGIVGLAAIIILSKKKVA